MNYSKYLELLGFSQINLLNEKKVELFYLYYLVTYFKDQILVSYFV